MATRRARVKMVPNFAAGNRGRARPGKIDVAADKTDCNDNKKINSETEKLNQVKANLVDHGGDQGKIVGVMKENIAGAFTRSRSRSSESEKINDHEKALDEKKEVGSLTRSRSRSNEKVKTKENVEPSKTASLAKIEPSKTATLAKIEASKRPDNPKTNFSPLVAKPQTEPKEKINEHIQSNDSHTNPTKDLKINPPTDSPETDNLKSLNQEKSSDDPIPAVKTTSSPIDSPKTVSNSPNQPSTIPPSNVDLNQHSSSSTNAPTRPLPPSRNAPNSRPALPARFKQKFKPNLGVSDSRVRRARKLSGGDKRTRTLSGGGECSPAMQKTTSGECSPGRLRKNSTECSPGRQRTDSAGSGSGPEEEAVSTVQTPPATIQSPQQAATVQLPPQAVQPPPPVEREVEEDNGMPSTPLLVSSKRISQEGSSRRTSLEGSSKLRKDELVVCKKEGRTRKISGPKFPEKPHNQLMLRKSEHKRKFQSGIPARQRMTMFDLIYYNPEHGKRMSTDEPETNPDDIIEKEAEEVVKNGPEELAPTEPVANVPEEDVNEAPKEEDNAMPVPQVKVGPNGEIILDEASTIVETTQAKEAKAVLQNSPVVFENSNRATNYGTWSKKRKHSDWSDKETLKFYRALSVVGTDFSMMASLFSAKTRQELKLKFKKEEKINGAMIDRCLKQQGQYTDLQEFDEDSEEDSDPPVVQKRARQKSKPKKLRAGTRRITKNRGYYSSSDAEDDSELSPSKPSSRLLHKASAGISQRPATHPAPGQLPPTTTQQPAPVVQVRPHTISVVRANSSEVAGDASSPRRASSPLLQNLLCRQQSQQPEGGGTSGAPQFPPGLLAANPGLSGVKPGSLVVVASPSKTDPSSQLLHVYMVSPKNRVASPSKALDEVINTNSGLVRARPNMSPRPGSMSPRPASRSPSPLSRPPSSSVGPSTVYAPTPSRKRTLSESSASSVSPTRKRTLSETEDPGSSTSQVLQTEEINLPVAKKSKPPEGSSDENI